MSSTVVEFRHVILEGTAYQAGRQLGAFLRESPGEPERLARLPEWMKDQDQRVADAALELFARHCPGVGEEIAGMADALGLTPHQMAFYAASSDVPSQCSQFAVSPSQTVDGHLYVGRNYEWDAGLDHDHQLITARIQGKAAHLGFSLFHCGRLDGINQHGLAATMTGQPFLQQPGSGLAFWVLVRSILDNCRSVEEGLEQAARIPTCFGFDLLLADRSGGTALLESAGSHRELVRAELPASTNHFVSPQLRRRQSRRMRQSVVRYQAIDRLLSPGARLSKRAIQAALSDLMPDGLCCHHYAQGLGTLWSIIFDVSAGMADICFGSPRCNPWYGFDLSGQPGVRYFSASLPEEPAPPDIWSDWESS